MYLDGRAPCWLGRRRFGTRQGHCICASQHSCGHVPVPLINLCNVSCEGRTLDEKRAEVHGPSANYHMGKLFGFGSFDLCQCRRIWSFLCVFLYHCTCTSIIPSALSGIFVARAELGVVRVGPALFRFRWGSRGGLNGGLAGRPTPGGGHEGDAHELDGWRVER